MSAQATSRIRIDVAAALEVVVHIVCDEPCSESPLAAVEAMGVFLFRPRTEDEGASGFNFLCEK